MVVTVAMALLVVRFVEQWSCRGRVAAVAGGAVVLAVQWQCSGDSMAECAEAVAAVRAVPQALLDFMNATWQRSWQSWQPHEFNQFQIALRSAFWNWKAEIAVVVMASYILASSVLLRWPHGADPRGAGGGKPVAPPEEFVCSINQASQWAVMSFLCALIIMLHYWFSNFHT
jgi:hypothetical protein